MSLMHCHSVDFAYDCHEVELIGGQRIGACLIKPILSRAWDDGYKEAQMDMFGPVEGKRNPYYDLP